MHGKQSTPRRHIGNDKILWSASYPSKSMSGDQRRLLSRRETALEKGGRKSRKSKWRRMADGIPNKPV